MRARQEKRERSTSLWFVVNFAMINKSHKVNKRLCRQSERFAPSNSIRRLIYSVTLLLTTSKLKTNHNEVQRIRCVAVFLSLNACNANWCTYWPVHSKNITGHKKLWEEWKENKKEANYLYGRNTVGIKRYNENYCIYRHHRCMTYKWNHLRVYLQ